jgi:hypothetical protein
VCRRRRSGWRSASVTWLRRRTPLARAHRRDRARLRGSAQFEPVSARRVPTWVPSPALGKRD